MDHTLTASLFAAWRVAEQQTKVLSAHWASALAVDDDAAADLHAQLAAQRLASHDAFTAAIAEIAEVAAALHYRRLAS